MADKENVIRGLKALERSMQTNQCYACSHEFVDAVNEFGDTILREAVDLLEQTDIIRCKNCKNAEILRWLDDAIICKKHNYTGVRPAEFFCADGERRT